MENKLYRLVFLTAIIFFAVGVQAQRRNARYVEYINKNIKKERHNNTIGIIMTKYNDYYVMEYCTDKNIYETTYKIINEEEKLLN